MELPSHFTYPFRYVPHPLVKEAAEKLIRHIDNTPYLKSLFTEGKMMGVLICKDHDEIKTLYSFSGLVNGQSVVDGFVQPIFDTTTLPELKNISTTAEASSRLQDRLFNSYIVRNGKGESMSIKEVFAKRNLVPPGGTGECAAPKLLNYAYLHGFEPLAMGEFWYGASPLTGEVRQQGRFYPACTGKCGPLLSYMTEGLIVEDNPLRRKPEYTELEVLYIDEDIIVANKPSGVLCAPGLTGIESLMEVLEKDYGKIFLCHRLDMDTSGVILYARTPESQVSLQAQFASREVHKTYVAHLISGKKPWKGRRNGTIALPLSADYYDRPRQKVDKEHGKIAITCYEILEIFPDGEMDVRFTPKTGRTHQLRVHAASELALGRPIKGDSLYGDSNGGPLMLHAESITIHHPRTNELMTFTSPVK